jgi:adenylate cyclase
VSAVIDPVAHPFHAANVILHLTLLGAAAMVITFDRRTPTSRALAANFALWGAQIVPQVWLRALGLWSWETAWAQASFFTGALATLAMGEWLIRVLRTAPPGRIVRHAQLLIRAYQLCVPVREVLDVFFLEFMAERYYGRMVWDGDALFWAMKSFEWFLLACPVVAMGSVMVAGVELEERRRVLAMMVATPFFLSPGVLPNGMPQILASLLGVLVFLVGVVGYHVARGQRGEFLSRFLSPEVRDRVAERGLQQVLAQQRAEISVVCADLRGFTAYAEAAAPERVADVLRRYYDLAGEVAARHHATIKDFAGDGVLVLVGAPQADPRHAATAVALARDLVAGVDAMLREQARGGAAVGIGAGVATGTAMVGVIESSYRHEYAAVGSVVNLAARLCAVAAPGEVRISDATAAQAACGEAQPQDPVSLKGYASPVANFSLAVVPASG